MSRDFYKYIATRIVEFFRQESENMHNGDRFCLKLDNYEMVTEVNNALIEETASHSIQGTFALSDTYETYTIKLSDREIVVAAQIGDMTDDFFATLRNLTLDINPNPILMISCSPIDTITSATRDMSAKGMPFHADALVETIERDIKSSSSLASDDVYLLSHELNRVKRDRFADRKSLFEYKSFLSSLRRGTVITGTKHSIMQSCCNPRLKKNANKTIRSLLKTKIYLLIMIWQWYIRLMLMRNCLYVMQVKPKRNSATRVS